MLRATQFHEFAQQTLDRMPKPLAVVPRMRTQPVAAREVAQHLVKLVLAPAQGMAPELAGPRVEQVVDMVGRLLRARQQHRLLLPVNPRRRRRGHGGRRPAARRTRAPRQPDLLTSGESQATSSSLTSCPSASSWATAASR